MDLVDTHCHIQSISPLAGDDYTAELWRKLPGADIDELISRAKSASVTKLIIVGCTLDNSILAVDLVKSRPNTWASVGIHPHEAKDHIGSSQKVGVFSSLVKKDKVIAIGECGLDYYYEHSPRGTQIKMLEFQLQLALDNNLPIIFHVRQAFKDFWPVFNNFNRGNKLRGVLHSYTDNLANFAKALDHGLYIGVNGIATFNKDPQLTEVHKQIPLNRLLLETDSPFLTPSPIRGTINEPKNIALIASFLADLRGEDFSRLAQQTTINASELFLTEKII
ncbi:MAG TPA: TatD family hydrolase [Candidatus Saccharimonadales bacterium]